MARPHCSGLRDGAYLNSILTMSSTHPLSRPGITVFMVSFSPTVRIASSAGCRQEPTRRSNRRMP